MHRALGTVLLWLAAASGLAAEDRATTLVSLKLLPSDAGLLAILEADGTIEHQVVDEQNPGHRLVLDVLGTANPLRHYYPPESHPFLERILMYEYPPSSNPRMTGPLSRIIFELKRDVDYRIESSGQTLRVEFGDFGDATPVATTGSPATPSGVGAAVAGPSDATATATDVAVVEDPRVPPRVRIEPSDVDPGLFFHPSRHSNGDYRLGPEDVIEIRVFELDQLNRTVRVSGDGLIELPLVGSLQVTNQTSDQVSAQIADRLRDRFVQNPQVSIFINEFNSQKVSLLGAVAAPSTYPLSGQRRLLQVLAEAGSLAADAGRTLYVFRQTDDGRSARLTVPLNELLMQGDPRWNIALLPGDVISVPPEQAIAVSVLGAVNTPGVHKLPVGDDATLLKAIALAGGLNERASKKGIQIKRRDDEGNEVIVKADLGDILSGKKPDLILREGDVVVVNESFF